MAVIVKPIQPTPSLSGEDAKKRHPSDRTISKRKDILID